MRKKINFLLGGIFNYCVTAADDDDDDEEEKILFWKQIFEFSI